MQQIVILHLPKFLNHEACLRREDFHSDRVGPRSVQSVSLGRSLSAVGQSGGSTRPLVTSLETQLVVVRRSRGHASTSPSPASNLTLLHQA